MISSYPGTQKCTNPAEQCLHSVTAADFALYTANVGGVLGLDSNTEGTVADGHRSNTQYMIKPDSRMHTHAKISRDTYTDIHRQTRMCTDT